MGGVTYILATVRETDYLRKGEKARFRTRQYRTFEEVSEGLQSVLNYYSNNSWVCNDWAIRYFIIQCNSEQNCNKLIIEGRAWLVPWKVYQ